MKTNLLLAMLLFCAVGTQATPAQSPVYTLIYYPPALSTPGGQPAAIFEAAPGLFYVLSLRTTNIFGPSIFTITSSGTFKLIYSFPPAINSGNSGF
jgi:hypothetical protein